MKRIKYLLKKKDQVFKMYAKLGSYDTEPRHHFCIAVRDAFEGISFKNLTASQWELYSSMPGADAAAVKLNRITGSIVCEIQCNKICRVKELKKELEEYL